MIGGMDDSEQRFPSKIDWWLPVLLVLVMLAGPISILFGPKRVVIPAANSTFIAVAIALPMLLVGWMLVSTVYVIDGANLRVKCGPMRIVVPIDSITSIERGSLASAPALSLTRLSVRYGSSGMVTISPKDMRGFIHAIMARVPHLVLRDVDEYR